MLEMKQTTKFKKDLKRLKKRNANLEKLKTVMQMIIEEVPLPEEEYHAHIL
ncbi:type II toxin-antitoxin system mRNA interferase toxin, RelE/StbE family [Carnobacterium sp. ISL-102]|nr:type II toxin-antitoxin system mRNA interferase toxin, RelE/StbE family [Carnobacterium sp. ISL-102]